MSPAFSAQVSSPLPGSLLADDESLERHLSTITADGSGSFLESAISTLLRLVREQLELEAVFVGEIVGDARVFRYISSAREPALIAPGQSHPLELTLCKRIADGRIPPVVGDVSAVRVAHGLPAVYDIMGAHVGVPVRLPDGRLYGVLCGFCLHARHDLDEREVLRLQVAARAAARLLAQAEGVSLPDEPAPA
ncbi:GAF domain-containing protein [Variovorax dokdonensis]|uniref:GAF domain-containing protein n=1 Tax=Variovorax dokdonensis TaxID=344883 RepID=A0ABT7N6V7_9BURK|nr:GAF domain-containing protein [Variovorax dokdonensis]MDM0043679.1 GAF domain-containing protein [Variovorax dokdonensis]